MKNLKYIKLFEAFESEKLSKTLKFINKEYRSLFISDIKSICNKMNFPLSEISDDLFQYLPYRKALAYHKDTVKIKCTAESDDQFGGRNGISGEICKDGKLKRSWGEGRVRTVECPNCNGSGIEPFKAKWKYLKFWFSVGGDYVKKTATNGRVFSNDSMYKYDISINIRYGSIEEATWRGWSETELTNSLKEANFALVLDLDKLEKKSKKVKSTEITKRERYISKEDALALKSDNDVKKQNIKRYFDTLIERSKISNNLDDIKNLNKLIMRFMCGSYPLFSIHDYSDVDSMRKINSVSEDIYDIMSSIEKDSSQENKNSLLIRIDDVNYHIKLYLNSILEYKTRIKNSLELTKQYVIEKAESNGDFRPVKIFENIMSINDFILKYVSSYNIETLYDCESLLADLTVISSMISQKRYLYNINNFFDRTSSKWGWADAKSYLTDIHLYSKDLDSALEGSDRFLTFLKNKYSK